MNLINALQLQHRAQFERNVSWALLGGAGAGLLSAMSSGSRLGGFFVWAVAAGTVFFFAAGDSLDRWLMRIAGAALPAFMLIVPGRLGHAAAGAVTGLLLVACSVAARGKEGQMAQFRPSTGAYVTAAAFGGVLMLTGRGASDILSHALRNAGLHWIPSLVVAGAITALFVAFAALPAHVMVEADPVEAKATELHASLSGELSELCERMLGAYRRCGELLAQLPRDAARSELATVASRSVNDALDLAHEWQQVETQLEESSAADLDKQLLSLRKDAEAAKDDIARRQLLLAADSLAEEVERLGTLSCRRERVMARLKATCAELDRTRLSLLSLRSARTHTKATDLLALSRKLKSLSSLESTKGALESALATGAELAHAEAVAADDASARALVLPTAKV